MMTKELKRTKGITLIALVITIIVLLILAGVTIATLTGENGILNQAGKAKEKTQEAEAIERVALEVQGSYGTDGKIDMDMLNDNLKNNVPGLTYKDKPITEKGTAEENRIESLPATVKVNGYDIQIDENGNVSKKVIADRTGIAVGDYINYTPDGTSKTSYEKDKLSSTITGSTSNSSDINQNTLNWQVLRIYDDGSMDLIGSQTIQIIYFSGALGYNNGVYVMNDICKTLYSRSGIEARSVNLDDVEYWLTDTGKTTRSNFSYYSGGPTYGNTQTYTGSNSYYPNIYQYQNGAGINTTDVKTNGISESDSYYSEPTTENYSQANTSGLTVTQTYYYISSINETNFGEGTKALHSSNFYWVASRYANCRSSFADFGLHYAGAGLLGDYMFLSYSGASSGSNSLRPVVSLGSNVQITPCEGENSTSNTHKITQY